MFSKLQKSSLLITAWLCGSFCGLSFTAGGLGAQSLLQRGGIDVDERRGKFGLDVGVGLAGIGDETTLAYSLAPSYEFWRRGHRALVVTLPLFYLSKTDTVSVGDLEFAPGRALEVAPSLELELASFSVGRNCCSKPSFFLGGGFRLEPSRTTVRGDERFRLADRTSPLVTAGAAMDLRFTRRYALRIELRVTTVFEDEIRLETPLEPFLVEGENVSSGLLTVGLALDF